LIALYGFGDASGAGFGSSITLPNGWTKFRRGLWAWDQEDASSNYLELCNLVQTVEEGIQDKTLSNSELFIFTDNTTAEGAYYKGNTPSWALFDLVLGLHTVDMLGSLQLHFIHVAGTRMVQQGTDGLSWGSYSMGVMSGAPMLAFAPAHLSATEQSYTLLPWLNSRIPTGAFIPLNPAERYELRHGIQGWTPSTEFLWMPVLNPVSIFLWSPAPAAASAAVDEMGVPHHKCPHLSHIFVCPHLFTHMW
jgi:hypothetical protein